MQLEKLVLGRVGIFVTTVDVMGRYRFQKYVNSWTEHWEALLQWIDRILFVSI